MRVLRLAGIALSLPLPLLAQAQKPSLEGAWKIAEVVVTGGQNPRTISNPQPSLYLFTKGYYSIMMVTSEGPRPLFESAKDPAKLSDAEKVARYEQWSPFTANSGTYEVKDGVATFRPVVAKNDSVMTKGSSYTRSVQVEAKTLWLVNKSPTTGAETKTKLTRVD